MNDIPERVNLTSYYLDSNLELGRGNRPAIHYEGEKYTYAQVAASVNKVGNALKDLGVEPEDRVLMVLNDSPEFVATWFGIIKIGAVATDAYTFLQTKDYEYFLNYTKAKVAIVDESVVDRIQQAAGTCRFLKKVVVVGKAHAGAYAFNELVDPASERLQAEDTHADDIALWKFTSGTTGKPKGVALCHRNSIYNFLHYGRQILKYSEDDITLSVSKLYFGYARDASLVYAFGSGASAALFPERSTEEVMFKMIEKYRPTVFTSVPTMMSRMIEFPDRHKYDLSSIRFCNSGAEALPAELYHRWKKTFGIEIINHIGSAEMYHGYLSNRLDDVRAGSLGKPVPGYEAKIMNEEGAEVADGEIGVLWAKGKSAGYYYFNDYEKTKKTFVGEWVNTGDLFRKDEDGYFWFMGRGGDLLKVGGIFVAPLEIENCLLGHAAVAEAAVIGATDEQGLTKPKAFVVLKEGFTASETLAAELQQYVKTTLAPYKFPRWMEFIAELPKDDRGKVRKRTLK